MSKITIALLTATIAVKADVLHEKQRQSFKKSPFENTTKSTIVYENKTFSTKLTAVGDLTPKSNRLR